MKPILTLTLGVAFLIACNESQPTAESSDPLRPVPESRDSLTADSTGAVVTTLDLGTLGGSTSSAADIDIHGVVVGTSRNAAEKRRGFRWTEEGGMTELPPLPGDDESVAGQILPDGRIVGGSSLAGRVTKVIWSTDGVPVAMEPPPPPTGEVRDYRVDAVGQNGAMAGTGTFNFKQSAWYWSSTAGFVDITATTPGKANESSVWGMNQSGYVFGRDRPRELCDFKPGEFGGLCIRAFLWKEDVGYIFIGSPDHSSRTEVSAGGVNNSGEVAGVADYFGRGADPFRWSQAGGWVLLPTPEGEGSGAGINNRGTVVGEVHRPGFPGRAALWTRSGVLVALATPDSLPSGASAVNDHDVVVGSAPFNGVIHAARWSFERP